MSVPHYNVYKSATPLLIIAILVPTLLSHTLLDMWSLIHAGIWVDLY